MRYKIFQAARDTSDPVATKYNQPVIQYRAIKLIELDFSGQNNDFTDVEDAETFILNNPNLKGYDLVILPYIKS